MPKYICTGGHGDIEIIEAKTADDAAQEYVYGGDWIADSRTEWIDVSVTPLDDDGEQMKDEREKFTVEIEPTEPDCEEDDHDWRSPYSLLGGIKENPGVWGHGGGVVITEVCAHCGVYRVTDTWDQRAGPDQQGLESTEYRDADDASVAWVERRKFGDVIDALDGVVEDPAQYIDGDGLDIPYCDDDEATEIICALPEEWSGRKGVTYVYVTRRAATGAAMAAAKDLAK